MEDYKDYYKQIVDNLEFIRMSYKMNYKSFRDKISISHTTYNNVRTGKGKPTLETLMKVKTAFGYNIDDLIYKDLSKKSDIQNDDVEVFKEILVEYGKRLENLESRVD